jgi:Tfp pilus assembly protein PilN
VLIEINLAPGAAGTRLRPKRFSGLTLPSLPSFNGNPRLLGGVGLGVLVLGGAGFGLWKQDERREDLAVRIEQEMTDSTRFASTIELVRSLQARRDTITRKIEVIRSVDTRRYVWAHLLDEISLALPAYVWLTGIESTEAVDSVPSGPDFTIQGRAGSTQALTRFMKNLEASPFVVSVSLITSEQEVVEGRTIQRFGLEARYREPDSAAIQTVPILVMD